MEQVQYTKENYIQALEVFLKGGVGQDKDEQKANFRQAEMYLVGFEKSKFSWSICCQVLQEPECPSEYQINTAKTLKKKLQYDYLQLTEAEANEFSEYIVKVIQEYSTRKIKRSVRVFLAIVLVLIYYRNFEKMDKFIDFLRNNFYSYNEDQLIFTYQVYELMPQEIRNEELVIEDTKRSILKNHLADQWQIQVFQEIQTLQGYLANQETQYRALKVAQQWIDFKYNEKLLHNIANHQIFILALNSMTDPELQNMSSTVIEEVMYKIRDDPQYQQLFQQINQHINEKYFPQCWSAIKEDVDDEIKLYTHLFMVFGKCFMKSYIIGMDDSAKIFLENMMKLSEYDGLDNSKEISKFWSKFFITISNLEDQQQKQNLLQNVEALIRKIVQIIFKRGTLSSEQFIDYNTKSPDAIDNFKDQYEMKNIERYHVKDILEDFTDCIGLQLTVKLIFEDCMKVTIAQYEQLKQQPPQPENIYYPIFCRIESSLSLIYYAIHKSSKEAKEQISVMIQEIQNFIITTISPIFHTKIHSTSLKFFKYFGKFTQEQIIGQAFQYVVSNMNKKYIEDVATDALEELMKTHQQFVLQNIKDFHDLMEKFPYSEEIVEGITTAITSNPQLIQQHLVPICQPYVVKLQKLVDETYELEPGQIAVSVMKSVLDNMVVIFKALSKEKNTLEVQQLLVNIYSELQPMIFHLFDKTKKGDVIEKLVQMIKYIMRSASEQFGPYLQKLLQSIIKNFKEKLLSPYLYLIEVATTVYGQMQEYQQFLVGEIQKITQIIFQHFQTFNTVLEAFIEEPYIVDDFYGMCLRILRYSPLVFFESNLLEDLIQLCIQTTMYENTSSAKVVYTFVEFCYHQMYPNNVEKYQALPQQYQGMQQTVYRHAPNLVKALMKAYVEYIKEDVQFFITDVIYAIIYAFPQDAQVWCQNAMSELFSVDIIVETERQEFLQAIPVIRQNQQNEDIIMESLQLISRRCMRSYMRQYDSN